jgi:RNA polymerase sigma factor (sigma-70 family)
MNGIVQQLCRAASAGLSDSDLLDVLVNRRDEAAFEALLRRHGPMVLAVCRRTLRNTHDAEDAFQATFLVLLRKAGSLRRREALAGWLHAVAYHTARKARAMNARRHVRETEAAARIRPMQPDPDAGLDEALDALPEKYRLPVVLCELQGRPRKDVARQLNIPEGTLSSRLATARKMLAKRLRRHGEVLAGAAPLAAGLPAVPELVRAAGLMLAGREITGVVSAGVIALTEATVKNMFANRLRTLIVVAVVLATVGIGTDRFRQAAFVSSARASDGAVKPVPGTPGTLPADARRLAGTWVFDDAWQGKVEQLFTVWKTHIVVTGESFSTFHFAGFGKGVRGSFSLGGGGDPKAIDLKVQALDLTKLGVPVQIPDCTLPGIWKLDGDRLTVVLAGEPGGPRPTSFDASGDAVGRITLVRTPAGFQKIPDELTVKVAAPDGKPAAGVTIATFMGVGKKADSKDTPAWKSYWNSGDPLRTGADGTVKVRYQDLQYSVLIASDPVHHRMAVANLTPARATAGEVHLVLQPECRITGSLVSEKLKDAGKAIGWTNVYLEHAGRRMAMSSLPDGELTLLAPPGEYALYAYGENVRAKYTSVTVPAGTPVFHLDPIKLAGTNLAMLMLQDAPELEGVVAWKGKAVRLADLRGKYVLLEFWGYWCNPCVASMPVLIALQERFGDKGLAVVGVHVDADGEVDTVAKLEEKLDGIRKKRWDGKDLPFPVALASGKRTLGEGDDKRRGGPVEQYGITSYPTTILIDKQGKVLGKFSARELTQATAEVQKLLNSR